MQQKFRMFLYIIRPIGIRVKICDYVNQNTAHSRGIDLSERMVLEMSVITKAGLLALAAVLLLPSAQTTQAAQPEPLIVIVQKRQDAQERTLRVLRDGSVEEAALDTYLAQVVLSEMPASFAPEALKAQAVAARTFACRQTAGGKHENADVCAQSACCQACLTVEDLRARYGDGFEAAWDKALAAVRDGADYLGSGAVFGSTTKTNVHTLPHETLQDICRAVDIPVVAIGGITKDNLLQLAGTGIDGVALVSAIFAAPDIEAECRALRALTLQTIRA